MIKTEQPGIELDQSVESEGKVLDPSSLQFYRAVGSAKEVHTICKKLVDENKDRNDRNAKIAARYNDDQPWSQGALNDAGQSWRSNFSSGFLSTIIKRAQPAYKKIVDEAKTLTSSELEDSSPEGKERAEIFRTNITRTIRRWSGWNDFVTQVSLENLLYGYTHAIKTDEIDWRPIFARQDEAFFPENCSQLVERVPYFCYRQKFQIPDLAQYLKNPQASADAGWNVNNLVLALNQAAPDNRMSGSNEDARAYEDVIRENTIGSVATRDGIKVIDTYHFFIREVTGAISHWIVTEKDGMELFVRFDRFESMSDCLSLFTIEIGNGKLHGSKGAGRLVYNRALSIERSRNIAADNYYLASLMILKTTGEGKRNLTMEVSHPFMVLGSGVDVVAQSFQVNEEAFRSLDNFNTQLAEQQIGSYTPSTALMDAKGDETAAKVNYVASVEQQIRDGVLLRWWNQVQALVYGIQKTICSPSNISRAFELHSQITANALVKMTRKAVEFAKKIGRALTGSPVVVDDSPAYDNDAVDCLMRMFKEGLTPEQIYELAQCPPQQTVEDLTARNAALIDSLSAKYMNDPLADKVAVRRDDVASKLGYSAAERWFPQDFDQTLMVEAVRQQLEEFPLLLMGEDVPVSPRDNDKAHLSVLMDKGQMLLTQLQKMQQIPPESLLGIDSALKHAEAHVQSAMSKGFKEVDLANEIAFVTGARQLMSSIGMGQPGQAAVSGGKPVSPQEIVGSSVPPPVPSIQSTNQLPVMDMTPVMAASTKPLSHSGINLTPQV